VLENATEPKRKLHSLFDEFKSFAFRGNIVDLAIGMVIGTAFGAVVTSLVKNIVMPLVTMFVPTDKGGYEDWKLPLLFGNSMPIGKFLGEIVSFLILAAALFIFMVKILGPFLKKPEGPPPPPTTQEKLLMEIRDLLKAQSATEGAN